AQGNEPDPPHANRHGAGSEPGESDDPSIVGEAFAPGTLDRNVGERERFAPHRFTCDDDERGRLTLRQESLAEQGDTRCKENQTPHGPFYVADSPSASQPLG